MIFFLTHLVSMKLVDVSQPVLSPTFFLDSEFQVMRGR